MAAPRLGAARTWVAAALLGACFLLVPSWIGGLFHLRKIHRALVYQAHLREDAATAVRELGGPAAVLRCGTVMTEGFQVPMIAYDLGMHTLQIEASPLTPQHAPPPPNVIFQTRAQRNAHLLPLLSTWPTTSYTLAAQVRTFRVLELALYPIPHLPKLPEPELTHEFF